jgi:DNA-directed RNA polymerase II subunit RPB2
MPSRMTLGKPIEFIVSKLGAMSGRNFDASAFSSLNVDTFARALTAYGFSRKGTKVLYDGVTGRLISSYQLEQTDEGQRANLIPCQVFVGPCYYQRLRHEVIEKGHERGLEGKIDQRTQLPSGGKSKTGIATSAALRFGEMERDALISYGSSSLARERMITLADDYTLVVCTECGTEAAYKKDIGFMCRNCKCDKFGKLKVPYSILIFRRLLSGMNVNIKFAVEKVPEEQRTRR